MRLPRRGRQGGRGERQIVGGLPVYWADAPGPFTAALLFRVGAADEELPWHGLCHLVEHLALFPIGQVSFTVNGFVQDLWTAFYAVGEKAEVLGLLTSVCHNLSALPLDRLETEKRILTTESASRSPGWRDRVIELRFGPRGFGLGPYEEFALRTATAEDVERWSRERFVKGNAAMWMTGRPPAKLDLPLRAGERSPLPALERRPRLDVPSQLAAGSGGVVLGMLGERSSALTAGFSVIVKRAEDRLRLDLGLSYNVGGVYEPLGAGTAHLAVGADCLDEHAFKIQRELMAILDDIAADGPTAAELARVRDEYVRAAEDPTNGAGWMDYAVRDELLGAEVLTRDEVIARTEALTPEEVGASIAACLPELIVVAPTGTPRPPNLKAHGDSVPEPVAGTRTYHNAGDRETYFVAGERGITLHRPGEAPATMVFSECAAALRFSDRRLALYSQDGSLMEIAGLYLNDGAALIRYVLDHISISIVVPMEDVQTFGSLLDLYVEKLGGISRPQEFNALQEELHPGERLEDLAALKAFGRRGLLALTDRRLLCLWRKKNSGQVSTEETLLADLRGAEVDSANGRLRPRVVVHTKAGTTLIFEGLKPRRRVQDFRERLAALADHEHG